MSGTTTIEWVRNAAGTQGKTWNPVTGCDQVSPGCDNCYALTLANRLKAMGNRRYQVDGHALTSGPGFGLQLHDDLVDVPRHVRKPTVWFVNSMSDMFHERVPHDFRARVWDTMVATPQHTYQILTKRATHLVRCAPSLPWPPNVWMGVTVENQDQVERRAERLCRVPAAVRFLSVEPLIGPVDIRSVLWDLVPFPPFTAPRNAIHWVIAGGESGPRARLCELDWLRSLRDQCQAAGIPFFLKQLGTVAMAAQGVRGKGGHDDAVLDGRRWLEMPA